MLRRLMCALALTAPLIALPFSTPAHAVTSGFVRVDQVGYATGEVKRAYFMTTTAARGESYAIVASTGAVVARGTIGANAGAWSTAFPDVYVIDFSRVQTAGTYTVRVSGPVSARSVPFRIGSAQDVIGRRLADFVKFFRTQRDGANVPAGQLDRSPSHLNLRHASVYRNPTFVPGSDTIIEPTLTKIGGPTARTVDVEGGWFDAGDYLKFTHNNSYADAVLFLALRDGDPGNPAVPALRAEAHYGLDWLSKMWDPTTRVLYFQVGIGSGDKGDHFLGDHDVWRLPQADDTDLAAKQQYLHIAPVFRANAPGEQISPNLAGRVAAAFALAAQTDAAKRPARARAELQTAATVYGLAKTHHPGQLVTALPHEFYPESTYKDDLEFAGAELALAGQALHDPRSAGWLRQAAHWAAGYLAAPTSDTLNLYDTSALGHADLIRAIRAAGTRGSAATGLEVSTADLLGGLRAQLNVGATRAAHEPFGLGANEADFDVDSHSFGLAATAALYHRVTGSSAYDSLGTASRNWVMGANAWGTSFVVGFGEVFPHCLAGELPNLPPAHLDGTHPFQLGAVVNGPNNISNFTGRGHTVDPGYLPNMRHCGDAHNDPFAAFTGANHSKYTDDVRSWQTSEEAVDMDGSALLAYALNG